MMLGSWFSLLFQASSEAEEPQRVDPQTFQASTAAELTYGKDKARQMLNLKRGGVEEEGEGRGSLSHPQDVTGHHLHHLALLGNPGCSWSCTVSIPYLLCLADTGSYTAHDSMSICTASIQSIARIWHASTCASCGMYCGVLSDAALLSGSSVCLITLSGSSTAGYA